MQSPVFPASMKPMREVAVLLEDMLRAGVVTGYAIFGAVAQMRYTEPVATRDVDVLITVTAKGLDLPRPVYDFCRARGCREEAELMRVGVWLVQFIPVFNPLTEEALKEAQVVDFQGVSLRVVRADYLALIALDTGRKKDYLRILSLVDAGAVTLEGLKPLAARHGLARKLEEFREKFGD